jgi:hypothetical protein
VLVSLTVAVKMFSHETYFIKKLDKWRTSNAICKDRPDAAIKYNTESVISVEFGYTSVLHTAQNTKLRAHVFQPSNCLCLVQDFPDSRSDVETLRALYGTRSFNAVSTTDHQWSCPQPPFSLLTSTPHSSNTVLTLSYHPPRPSPNKYGEIFFIVIEASKHLRFRDFDVNDFLTSFVSLRELSSRRTGNFTFQVNINSEFTGYLLTLFVNIYIASAEK